MLKYCMSCLQGCQSFMLLGQKIAALKCLLVIHKLVQVMSNDVTLARHAH